MIGLGMDYLIQSYLALGIESKGSSISQHAHLPPSTLHLVCTTEPSTLCLDMRIRVGWDTELRCRIFQDDIPRGEWDKMLRINQHELIVSWKIEGKTAWGEREKAGQCDSMDVRTELCRIRAAGRPKQRRWWSPHLAWSCAVPLGMWRQLTFFLLSCRSPRYCWGLWAVFLECVST